jgi:hypothetical protein
VEALCSSFDLVSQLFELVFIFPFMPYLLKVPMMLLIILVLCFKEGFHFSQNTEVMPDVSDEDKHGWKKSYDLKNC